MFLVLGIDAATWTIVSPNLDKLPNFQRLCNTGKAREITLAETPLSPSVWCGMFCGKTPDEHGHEAFVAGGDIVKREDINVDFIWDILDREGKTVQAMNVPFVIPPYSFNVDFKPIGFGLPTNEKEWWEELQTVTEKTKELMKENPDVLIAVYSLLDRVQHFHWGEDCVLEWYERVDRKLGEILDTGFLENANNRLIVISDHGFCSFGDAKVQTLPEQTPEGTLKGDHHENALVITVNVPPPADEIERPQDVFYAIREAVG